MDPEHLTQGGSHLVVGDAGAGKSSLLSYIAFREASHMLEDDEAVAFDKLRLPVLVHARSLLMSVDFASALRAGATELLSTFLRTPLPVDFFQPDAPHGHRRWLVLVDGVEEIDEADRARALGIIASHARRWDTFHFIVAIRPEVRDEAATLDTFSEWSLRPLSDGAQKALIDRSLADPELTCLVAL